MDDELPPALLRKHPELAAVGEALAQWRSGAAISARCPKCGEPLTVEDVVETGTLVVRCPTGDTLYRAKRSASDRTR